MDLITLDLKEPWKAFDNAYKALKNRGELTCFSPNITQVMKIVEESKNKFKVIKILENIERQWIVEELRVRPENMIIGHTAFIAILRKI